MSYCDIFEREAYILELLEKKLTRAQMVKKFLERYGYIRVKEMREDMHITNPAGVILDLRRTYKMNIQNEKKRLGSVDVKVYTLYNSFATSLFEEAI